MVRSGSSMLKYTQAPGAVVSSCGSSETGSVGRTIVSVPPRFWASAGANAPRTTVPAMAAASMTPRARRTRFMGRLSFVVRTSPAPRGGRSSSSPEVLPVHLTAPVLEVADDLAEAAREGRGDAEGLALARQHAELAIDLSLPLAYRKIAPDAGLRLRVRSVVRGDGAHGATARGGVPGEGSAIPGGIELVEGLDAYACLVGYGQPLAHDADEHALDRLRRLHHLVDVGVDDGGAEEKRAVDQLAPLVAPDVVGDRRLHEGAEQGGQLAHARRDASVELAQDEGPVSAV